jgi:cytochrome c oxidase subunit 4
MTATSSDVPTDVDTGDEAGHAHPDEKTYLKIALILGALTVAEVATYPLEDTLEWLVLPILLVLMTIKFYYVAAFFMHLKFDSRIFSWVFVSGIVLASFCFLVALSTMEFWAGA